VTAVLYSHLSQCTLRDQQHLPGDGWIRLIDRPVYSRKQTLKMLFGEAVLLDVVAVGPEQLHFLRGNQEDSAAIEIQFLAFAGQYDQGLNVVLLFKQRLPTNQAAIAYEGRCPRR
jgi:hypothetical protein